MTTQQNIRCITLDSAAADLSGLQFRFVDMSATGVNLPTGAGARAIGVLQNKPGQGASDPAAGGFACEIATDGIAKVAAGAVAPAVGANVQTDANGRAILAAAGDHVIGVCTKGGGAQGDLIEVLLQSQHILA